MFNEGSVLTNTPVEKLAKAIELAIKAYINEQKDETSRIGGRLSEFYVASLKDLINLSDEAKKFFKYILNKRNESEMTVTYGISVDGKTNLPADDLKIKIEALKWNKTKIKFSREFVERASNDFWNINDKRKRESKSETM